MYRAAPGWSRFAGQVCLANLAMAALLWWMAGDTGGWLELHAGHRALRLMVCVLGGAAVYFAALWLCGLRLRDLRRV